MQDLTLVGLSEDGARLVLAGPAGEEYAVPVDDALRAALRSAPAHSTPATPSARPGQLEKNMDSALRPRDIQARIRAGESPEEVAAAAQTSVERIMGFATPVLAERAHVARTAQKASVRRRAETGAAARTLGEAAETFFASHRLHDEDVEWDAWRRPDGRWALVATYAVQGTQRRAEFTHDVPGRYVVADNDDARALTGELRADADAPGSPTATAPPRRLTTVPATDDLPLGDDAIELVRDREESVAPTEGPTDPEPAAAPEPSGEPEAEEVEPDEVATRTPDLVEPATDREEPDEEELAPAPATDPTAVRGDADWIAGQPALFEDDAPQAPAEPAAEEDPEGPDDKPRSARKKGRASVPSWDEIMFGGSDRG